jgi:thioesterase III
MNTDRTKVLESKVKVRFQHCDPLGHLNNSVYIDYFLNAREDQLLDYYNIDTYAYATKNSKAWVVANHKIDYYLPLKARQEVIVKSCLTAFTEKSITVHFEMHNQMKKCACMITTFVHIDLASGRPTAHNEEWMEFLNEVLHNI